jgi:hypothetical protein
VSCSSEIGDKTTESVEIAAVIEGNNTHAMHDVDWCIPQIHSVSQFQDVKNYEMVMKCLHSIGVSEGGNPVGSYMLSSVAICLSR